MEKYAVSDVAKALGVEREVARGLVKFLETIGAIENMGTRPVTRGRAESVYAFHRGFENRVCKVLIDGKFDS